MIREIREEDKQLYMDLTFPLRKKLHPCSGG